MNMLIYIVSAVALLSAAGLFMFLLHVRKARRDLESAIIHRFGRDKILCMSSRAIFFGIASLKYAQIRGNGILVLTRDELFFRRLAPEMDISIPLANITAVETTRSFLGKSIFKSLLRVDYRTSSGEMDSAAWYVKNLNNFRRCIADRLNSA